MAINRDRLIQLGSNTGVATDVWYPPRTTTATRATRPAYPYDPEAAKALLATAGYPDGFKTTAGSGWCARGSTASPKPCSKTWPPSGSQVELQQLESAVATSKCSRMANCPCSSSRGAPASPTRSTSPRSCSRPGPPTASAGATATTKWIAWWPRPSRTPTPTRAASTWLKVRADVLADTPAAPLFVAGYPDLRSPRIEDFVYNDTYHRPRYEQIWVAPENR